MTLFESDVHVDCGHSFGLYGFRGRDFLVVVWEMFLAAVDFG